MGCGGMKTTAVLERFRPFKLDSVRRIDRVIDYFGERRSPAGQLGRILFLAEGAPQARRRTESGVSVIVSFSARTR